MSHEHKWELEGEAGEYWYQCDCGEIRTWPDMQPYSESQVEHP
jgi:hypothetical protein